MNGNHGYLIVDVMHDGLNTTLKTNFKREVNNNNLYNNNKYSCKQRCGGQVQSAIKQNESINLM